MTREEAIDRLKTEVKRIEEIMENGEAGCVDMDTWNEFAKKAEWRETLIELLSVPTPDPKTGLVPCGCGGKAQIVNSSGYSRRLYVECGRCDIMLGVEAIGDGALQGIYRYDDQIIKDWNRAMGYWEEEGHD